MQLYFCPFCIDKISRLGEDAVEYFISMCIFYLENGPIEIPLDHHSKGTVVDDDFFRLIALLERERVLISTENSTSTILIKPIGLPEYCYTDERDTIVFCIKGNIPIDCIDDKS